MLVFIPYKSVTGTGRWIYLGLHAKTMTKTDMIDVIGQKTGLIGSFITGIS